MAIPAFVSTVPYADLAFANGYLGERPATDKWTACTDPQKNAALTQATQHMDTLPYSGFKNDLDSQREFPRNGAIDIPYEVACACCEEALAILNGFTLEQLQSKAGVSQEVTGDTSTTFTGAGPAELLAENRGFLSPMSLRLMAPWLRDDDSFFLDRVN